MSGRPVTTAISAGISRAIFPGGAVYQPVVNALTTIGGDEITTVGGDPITTI